MIKQFFKKVLISYLIIICCIFTPTYNAYAASAGGWAFNSFNVATSVVTALKGGVSASVAVAKSPVSQKIAKGIVGGVIVGAAIPLAISQISGIALTAADWVLDPANNAIKYRDKTVPANLCTSNMTSEPMSSSDILAATKERVGGDYTQIASSANGGGTYYFNSGWYLTIECTASTGTPAPYVSVPIPTIADKIYDNAKTDTASASIVNDAVKSYVNEGSADVALDAAKAETDATHACGTGTSWNGSACVADTPTTPTTPTDTPFDPTSIIDAINSVFRAIGDLFDAVMTLPDVINTALDDLLLDIKDFFQPVIDSFTDFVEWVKAEPTPVQAEPVEIQTPDMPQMESTDISFGGQCPQNFDLFGKPVKFTLFDSTVFCQFLSDWIRIPVIFSASLVAVYILGGRRSD